VGELACSISYSGLALNFLWSLARSFTPHLVMSALRVSTSRELSSAKDNSTVRCDTEYSVLRINNSSCFLQRMKWLGIVGSVKASRVPRVKFKVV
jgi:hypothetical protein